jgi:hypothetical protein
VSVWVDEMKINGKNPTYQFSLKLEHFEILHILAEMQFINGGHFGSYFQYGSQNT